MELLTCQVFLFSVWLLFFLLYNINMKFKDKLINFVKSKHFLILIIGLVVIISIDMLTKVLTDGKNIEIIDWFVNFRSEHNEGGGFSILSSHPALLLVFSILLIVGILIFNFFFDEGRRNLLYNISFSMILGGAIGNLIDRVFIGKVRDFIELRFIDFPIFNFADIMITIGSILLAIYVIFIYSKSTKKQVEKNDK